MVNLIFLVAVGLWLLIGFLFGLRRGPSKAIYWLGVNVLAIFAAIACARICTPMLAEMLLPYVPLPDALAGNAMLMEAAMAFAQMIFSVVFYLVLFFPLRFFIKVIAQIVMCFVLSKESRRRRKFSLFGAALGTLASFMILCAFLTPVAELSNTANTALAALASSSAEENQPLEEIRQEYLAPIAEHPLFNFIRRIGGSLIYDTVSTAEYQGVTTNLRIETGAMEGMFESILPLISAQPAEWEQEQFDAMHGAVDSFSQSRLIPTVTVAFLHAATDSWTEGEAFMGVQKPSLAPMFDPTMDLILANFGKTDTAGFTHSLDTLVSMFEVLWSHGAVDALLGENESENAIFEALAAEGLMQDLVLCLSGDANLRVFVPELMNICFRVLGDAVGIKQSSSEVYVTLMGEITTAITDGASLPKAERIAALTDAVYKISEQYGMHITPAGALYLSATLVEDLGKKAELTAADTAAWFSSYSGQSGIGGISLVASHKQQGGFSLLGDSNDVVCSAAFSCAYPVTITSFSMGELVVTVWGMSDGSLLSRSNDGTVLAHPNPQAFAADYAGVEISIGNDTDRGWLTSCAAPSIPEFKLLISPRQVTASEAASANELRSTDAQALGAILSLSEMLSAEGCDSFPVPSCIRKALEESARKNGMIKTVPETVDSAAELIDIACDSAMQNGMSTGNAQTLLDENTMRTNRVTLDKLLLDSQKISDSMDSLDREAIAAAQSQALSSMLQIVSGGGEGEGDGEGQSQTLNAALSALNHMQEAVTQLSPDSSSPSLISGILQSDSVKDIIKVDAGDLAGLTDIVNTDKDNTSQVLADLMETLTTFEKAGAGDAEQVRDLLSNLLTNITPVGAKAISETIKPSLCEMLQVPERAAQGMTTLVTQVFSRLATLKEQGNMETFEKETNGMLLLLDIAVMKREDIREDPDALFGEEGVVGLTAADLLAAVLDSHTISESVLAMLCDGTKNRKFALQEDASEILSLPALTKGNRKILEDAINDYWDTHAADLPEARTAADLYTVTGKTLTKTDLARRLAAIAAIFRLEYENPYLNLPESAVIRTITLRGSGEGTITIQVKQNGKTKAVAENGGVEGLCTTDGSISSDIYSDWIIVGTTGNITLNPALYETYEGELTVIVRNLL